MHDRHNEIFSSIIMLEIETNSIFNRIIIISFVFVTGYQRKSSISDNPLENESERKVLKRMLAVNLEMCLRKRGKNEK